MPELPEVETIRSDLEREILQKRIIDVQINLPRIIKIPSVNEFKIRLKGQSIKVVQRKGKYLLCFLNNGESLIFHLGMSGSLLYQRNSKEVIPKIKNQHNHLIFFFEDSSIMIYNDVRQFGKIWLIKADEKLAELESLGWDPFAESFTLQQFAGAIQSKKGNIKSLLMNQKIVAGIGNIYANEILFRAGIHPLRKGMSLTNHEVRKLYRSLKEILSKAVQSRGTTMADESYRDLQGQTGYYANLILIYGKRNERCPVCGNPISVIRIENRSTFFCLTCQK